MAFKLTSPFPIDNTPIYSVDMEDGVLGKANNNGTIIINKDVSPNRMQEVIDHEMIHINQMRRGDLDYDNKNVYWKGKVCLLYTSPSPRDRTRSRMPSSA